MDYFNYHRRKSSVTRIGNTPLGGENPVRIQSKMCIRDRGVVFIGTIMTVIFHLTCGISLPDMVGILCGATTNTPALGAAQQTLKQMGLPSNSPALSCAVTYPLAVSYTHL